MGQLSILLVLKAKEQIIRFNDKIVLTANIVPMIHLCSCLFTLFFLWCSVHFHQKENILNSPTPEQIHHARISVGLTYEQAANVVYSTRRAWEYWESGARSMSPGLWELFLMKISGTIPRKSLDQPRGVVVIFADNGTQFIDVVADDNFLSLELLKETGNYLISSLAIDKFSGRPYVHKTEFKKDVNLHVIDKVETWNVAKKEDI